MTRVYTIKVSLDASVDLYKYTLSTDNNTEGTCADTGMRISSYESVQQVLLTLSVQNFLLIYVTCSVVFTSPLCQLDPTGSLDHVTLYSFVSDQTKNNHVMHINEMTYAYAMSS